MERAFECRYGYFDTRTTEFVITDVLTPRPWVNVLSNGRYGLVISQLGGGFSWLDNCQLHRISRWEQDLAVDGNGRYLYWADVETGQVGSTTFAPIREPAEFEEVRHGLGFTVFRRKLHGIETHHTIFVPGGLAAEIQLVDITNRRDVPANLAIGSYLEWQLGGQSDWHREFHRLFMSLEVSGSRLLASKRADLPNGSRSDALPTLSASVQVSGLGKIEWFTDKAQFLGRAGRLDRPDAMVKELPSNPTGRWDDPIAAFRARVTLQPGETRRFVVSLSAALSGHDLPALPVIDAGQAEVLLDETKRTYAERYGALEVKSSDPVIGLMNNAWLPYQAEVGRMRARCAYYQQGGAYGFRDQLQDSLMLLETEPQSALNQLAIHAEAMYEDGGVRHWWHPGTDIYVESRHSDTSLWPAYVLVEYLDETADDRACGLDLAYLGRESQRHTSRGTLLDHCLRGIDRTLEQRSPRGLPLIGSGDWNDGLSHAGIEGKGESVWLAMFLFHILERMVPVLRRTGFGTEADRYVAESESLRSAVETHGWDGSWYIAGTSDDGRPFGSNECKSGRIFLNPQTWAVISGIGSEERRQRAMESVRNHLLKPYGALLLAPAYSEVDPHIGYITRYAPGLRENGGVYSHAATWAIQAFARMREHELAYQLYRSMLPPVRAADDPDRYQAEPYVMPGNVDGPDSPYEGRAGWTWYTGTAAWMRRTATQWLFGVRPGHEGLLIRPDITEPLGTVRMVRPFRGDRFELELRPDTAEGIWVDGLQSGGGPIPASGQCLTRKVQNFNPA